MSWWRGLLRRPRGAIGELPEGLWRADFARIDRAAQRFVQVSGGGAEWGEVLAVVLEARSTAWQRCVAAAAIDPRPSLEVPGDPGLASLHRALARAAVQCAQAAEAVVMAGGRTVPDGGAPDGGAPDGKAPEGKARDVDTTPAARAAARALALVTANDRAHPGLS